MVVIYDPHAWAINALVELDYKLQCSMKESTLYFAWFGIKPPTTKLIIRTIKTMYSNLASYYVAIYMGL